MKRLVFISLFVLTMCSKPEDTMFEPTTDLWCVDCWDIFSHMAWIDCFCGESDEADKFIVEAKKDGEQVGMVIYCNKHKH